MIELLIYPLIGILSGFLAGFFGVGGGLAYDKLGSTHHACEDIALMRTIPNLDVYTPYDPNNVRSCINQAYNSSIKDVSKILAKSFINGKCNK